MKIIITGHTRDIGKGLYDFLSENGHTVLGCSSSNGYDILTSEGQTEVLNLLESSDVLINNACVEFSQAQLLDKAIERFYDTDKKIINVGSRIAEIGMPENPKYPTWLTNYFSYKTALKEKYEEHKNDVMNLQLEYVTFGYVLTETIMSKYPDDLPESAITVEEAVGLITGTL